MRAGPRSRRHSIRLPPQRMQPRASRAWRAGARHHAGWSREPFRLRAQERAVPTPPQPRIVSGARPGMGHFEEFLASPATFMLRAWRECGELAEFDLGGMRNVLLVGPDAQEAVFRASDEQLSAADSYRYMVPVFGEGIQFGAPLEIERQQVKMQANALRAEKMKGYARVVADEVEEWIRGWGGSGEKDFYEEFKQLVLRTSTQSLMGSEDRTSVE